MASLLQTERELLIKRIHAGLVAAKTQRRVVGRKPKMTPSKLKVAKRLIEALLIKT